MIETTNIGPAATTVDTWTLTTIPEPGTAALLALGLGALGLSSRRARAPRAPR